MPAAVYTDPSQQYAVTPAALTAPTTPDPLAAGRPPPINALTIPAAVDPNTGLTPIGRTAQLVSLSTPTQSLSPATQVGTKSAAFATDDPYSSYLSSPVSLQRFQRGLQFAEGWRPGQAPSSAGATGPWQTIPETVRNPGYGIQGGDPNNPADVDRVGEAYSEKMYQIYGPVMGAAAYNWGPGNVDKYISRVGDPRKGQISLSDWVSGLPSGPRPTDDVRGYVHKVAGGQLALPTQSPPSATITAANVIRPADTNPLALRPAATAPADDMQAQMRKYMTLAALTSLLPAGFAFHPVAYDPRQVLAVAKGQFSGVRGGTLPMSGMPGSFQAPRVVLGAGMGPSAPAISPASVPGFQAVRRRGGG